MSKVIVVCMMFLTGSIAVAAPNYAISSEPYFTGGLFTDPLIPHAGREITIGVRARCDGGAKQKPSAQIEVLNAAGETVFKKELRLQPSPVAEPDKREKNAPPETPQAETSVAWTPENNGLFRVRAVIDPGNAVHEADESDNAAELALPVVVAGKGGELHFPWYRESPNTRWCTCITSSEKTKRLLERGVTPLNWSYGGMSWSNYDKEKAKTDPGAVLADIEKAFYERFTDTADVCGFGIDEVGGYPNTFSLDASVASLKALARAKAEMPSRCFAVWSGGGLRPEVAAYCRKGADLLLIETYLWRALPDELGCQDIYAGLDARIGPFIRSMDMFQPAYGNPCHTLFGLDTSERPDRTDPGELEQVVRYIRQKYPEMRGVAWYNGGYGGYGLKRNAETDKHHESVLRKADDLCFQYWIKPCITLMDRSLWLSEDAQGGKSLVLAVNNLGSIDSGEVVVEFFADGSSLGTQRIDCVPAGTGRNRCMAQIRQPIGAGGGPHVFKALIASAPGATVLDESVELPRYVP